jgi:hypothetical protein
VSGRSRRLPGVVALAVGLALAIGFVVALAHRPDQADVHLQGAPVALTQSLAPLDARFGDTVTARVSVFVDPSRVDPRSVRVAGSFAPYAVGAQTRRIRKMGALTAVDVVQRLRCLSAACVPVGPLRSFRFAPPAVTYKLGSRPARIAAEPWPALRVRGHVVDADLQQPSFRVGRPDAVGLGYRMPPRLTGYVLLVLAALAAVVGGWLVLRFVLERLGRRATRETTLRRILQELAAATESGDAERRRLALDELALELGPLDESLASASTAIAWARDDPGADVISGLAQRAEALEP